MARSLLAVPLAALALGVTAVPSPADHGNNGTRLEGRIVSINRHAHSFRLRDHDSLGMFSIRVTGLTRFDGIRGFSALHTGRRVDVQVVKNNGRLFATQIQRFTNNNG